MHRIIMGNYRTYHVKKAGKAIEAKIIDPNVYTRHYNFSPSFAPVPSQMQSGEIFSLSI
ncbi:hypothetical protein MAMMFC1_04144 [Methylomusa anaerophila]|uniref:Uncharacterized protein n=1 Tax=Methylomusa anaerophila TaxID=1930071 RepID=A0A348AQS9_9FIRM|nr:hypothetical protein MAMMFC1_04144 [Methylomusa anaerophila]